MTIPQVLLGPEMPEEITSWLSQGGPFPAELEMTVYSSGNETRVFEVLDRDANGFISQLRNSRKGKKGFVLRVRDQTTAQVFAAKLCIPADFDDGTSPLTELDHSSKLQPASSFIHLLQAVGRVERLSTEPKTTDPRPWVCFLSRWLDGSTLQECIENTPSRITPALTAKIAETLIQAVLYLQMQGLKHDDLHLGNLMLEPTDPILSAIDPFAASDRLVVIDLGSIKAIQRPTFKKDDDWSSLARCLAQLHNLLHKDRRIASRYSIFLRRFSDFIHDLSEPDPARHFPQPSDYLTRLRQIEDTLTISPHNKKSFHPFDAISAEHLANDELLLQLFVDFLPWINLVKNPEPSVLIGPRGCGKSMVFRHLSVRTHISNINTGPEILQHLGFFGVYIGCASDLGNDLLWLAREPERPRKLAESITTYFNLVLTRELLRSLATCSKTPKVSQALGLNSTGVNRIVSFLKEQLGSELNFIFLKGMDPLQICSDVVDRLRLTIGRDLINGNSAHLKLAPTFIRELCRTATTEIPGLTKWPIAFLLDDYTVHRLSPEIQSILNTVLWQRDPSYIVKVSSEPYGFNTEHIDGARIDVNREYSLIDAGELTISQEKTIDRRNFISQLLDKRLDAAGYKGKAETLIGPSTYKNDKELATAIRSKKGARIGQHNYYHGLHVLADAWSGDVATVLHMLREMFARANVTPSTECLIPHKDQHQSITIVSKALTDRVSSYHPFGSEMSKILTTLGELARRLLVDAPDKINRNGDLIIHRKYRLELSLPIGVSFDSKLLELPEGERLVALKHELVRRAVLIELNPSRAKEGDGRQTNRWQLRSSLLPSFGTSLTRDHYIDVKRIEDFAELLTNPPKFAEAVYQRYARSVQNDLFGDLGSEE